MKKVSVIIPCYNVTNYIDHCMRSLLDQTIGFENMEVIFVNDCSTDSTLGKLLKYEAEYPENIMVIPLEQNVKQGACRNIATQYATGEYINYVDADDYLVPTAFEKLYRIARANDTDMVEYDRTIVFDHEIYPTDIKVPGKDELFEVKSLNDRKRLLLSGRIVRGCWNKFYRREFVLENKLRYAEGMFDEECLFTMMAALTLKKYYNMKEKLYCYFQNPEGTLHNRVKDMTRRGDNAAVWYEILKETEERGLLKDIYREFELLFVENYFLRSISFSLERGIVMEPDEIREMQKTVLEYFPDAANNPYSLSDPDIRDLFIISTKELTENRVNELVSMAEKINENISI